MAFQWQPPFVTTLLAQKLAKTFSFNDASQN
jgi:hypothetical protein